jgi:UDP-N-acetylglucosamine--N-acetylmuramyl-(pentapeptide) pyrophosphoryl-undecaprenol N-acetylglucosamine transferase
MHKYKVVISGGGTGGHIFPAIAIANAIKKKFPSSEILFVGAKGRMEMEKVPAAGYKIIGLNIAGFQRGSIIKNLGLPFKIISSLLYAKKILKEFKADIAVGVGGYASGPLLRVASSMGIPTVVQEQNSFPGKTNIILSKKAAKICVAYDGMERFFPKEKIILTGNPVRQEVINNLEGKRPRGLEHFKLNSDKKTLLIIGGSLGARTINQSIEKNLRLFVDSGYQIVWQTGKA